MNTPQLARGLLSLLTIGVVALPYGRPVVCERVHNEQHVPARHAQHTWSPTTQVDGCHGLMYCDMVNVAPAREQADGVTPYPPVRESALGAVYRLAVNPTPPLPPPPKI